MSGWKVYIADDQTLFRRGIARLVKSFSKVSEVQEAANGKELIKLVKASSPDVILMDLEMPIMDGIEATEKILARYPKVKIVVLSMHDSQDHIFYLMELGAHAFLLKNAEPEEVKKAIESVIENDFYQNQLVVDALRRGTVASRNKKSNRPIFQISSTLTERESEIILLICRELTMKEIADKLDISERTVQNHRSRIMEKVGAKNTVGLVKFAYESGIIK